jgi:hypothetical protein
MNLKRTAVTAALALGVLAIILACDLPTTNLIARNEPTALASRTPRPTFTPRSAETDTPTVTDTPAATSTVAPTDTPEATATLKPTVRPTTRPRPTALPPTQPPAPTQPPPPTANPYAWNFANMNCEHSGGVYIHVRAYTDANDPSSNIDGIRTRVSYAPDGPAIDNDVVTTNGDATHVLSPDNAPPKTGTWYAWIVDNSGTRISQLSPAIVTNGTSCWQAYVNFVHS